MESVYFLDSNTGWAVGWGGVIIKTTNGGQDWTVQRRENILNLYSVRFIDENTGWAVGSSGTILKTTNGGLEWLTIESDPGYILTSVDFIDENIGWVAGHDGLIMKTTNGGDNWDDQTSFLIEESIYSIDFIDENIGWITGYEKIRKTTNGGQNWEIQPSAYGAAFYSLCFPDSTTGWVVGSNGSILKTTNGGETVTSIKKTEREIPKTYLLSQNYPNPFNPTTTINYEIKTPGNVRINIYDINGRLVKELVNEEKSNGMYSVVWNGRNDFGNHAASGTYFYQIISTDFVQTKKMILLK